MSTTEWPAFVPVGHAELLAGDVWYVPVRHHSPACARAVEAVIERSEPFAVLVEGPPAFDDLIELLVHPDAQMPLAIYSWAVLQSEGAVTPSRHAAYFPLCDYSPELVALRVGRRLGARLRFVDLDFELRAPHGELDEGRGLVDERVYAFSKMLSLVADQHGCRDHNELWDHLIEAASLDVDALVEAVAAYGQFARIGTDEDDVTAAREAAMATIIRDVLADREAEGSSKPIVVVTGAFHTLAVRDLVTGGPGRPKVEPAEVREAGHGLIRYSFDRLDTLSGYASGMPAPGWYQQVWAGQVQRSPGDANGTSPHRDAAAFTIDEVARAVRRRQGDGQPSTPSLRDAHLHAQLLAWLRGREEPSRSDVLDAITSTFVKSEISVDVIAATSEVMTGTSVGRLPPGTPRPPLNRDFDERAGRLGLVLDSIEPRTVTLDLYRSPKHRQMSRFLHGVSALGVAYAHAQQQPRYAAARGRDVLREIWVCRFSAETDMTLTEASKWGASISEAVAAQLQDEFERSIASQGTSAHLLRLVLRAAQRGVPDAIEGILGEVRARVGADPDLHSVATALQEADLLWTARAPLDGQELRSLPAVGEQLYLRACRLIDDIGSTPAELLEERVGDLRDVHHVLRSAQWLALDDALFFDGLAARRDEAAPRLQGAIDGIRWRDRLMDDGEVATNVVGHLGSTGEPAGAAAYLSGLITVARELLWHDTELIRRISDFLERLEDRDFVARLPGLRSAFAGLAPRETSRIAEQLKAAHGISASARVSDQSEAELLAVVELSGQVADRLVADGFGHWLDRSDAS